MPLGISDRNKMVLWPGCEGHAEFSLHTKNVRSVLFVLKRRGCCCNLSGGVALIVWFTTNGMRGKNNTIICVARASNSKRDCEHDLYCCLLPRCEALRTCRSGFLIATIIRQLCPMKIFAFSSVFNSCLLSQKLCHYLNQGHTWNDILMRVAHWMTYFDFSKLSIV